MKIRHEKNFKDYYDIYANNPNLSDMAYTWVRKPEEIKTNFSLPVHFDWKLDDGTYIYGFMLAFCGAWVPILAVERKGNYWEYQFCYRISDVPSDIRALQKTYGRAWKDISDLFGVVNHPYIAIHNSGRTLNRVSLLDMHRKLKTPVFVNGSLLGDGWDSRTRLSRFVYASDKSSVYINPNLKGLGFDKYMDAFTCFQRLEQFVCNELAESVDNKANIKIPDVLKAESHGFNKYSFRKDKEVK